MNFFKKLKVQDYIEILILIISIPCYFLTIFKGFESLNEYLVYMSLNVYLGMVLPLIHIIFLLIKEATSKEIVTSKYESSKYFIIMVSEGFLYYLVLHFLKNYFEKIHIILWILIPLIIIVVFVVFYYVQKNSKKSKEDGPKIVSNK